MSQVHSNAELSILVVDDDTLVRETTMWMLADAGYRVHEAEDGVAALELLEGELRVDLVISDINMPRMDGLSLAQQMHKRWPRLPVLLISGRPQPTGTQPYMAKPFGWSALMEAVNRLANRGSAAVAEHRPAEQRPDHTTHV